MEMVQVDLAVIGAGPAGQKGAIQGAKAGKKVVLIDRMGMLGGACLHQGTIPSKALRLAILDTTGHHLKAYFGDDDKHHEKISMKDLQDRLNRVISDQNQELRNELQKMRSWREAALQLEQENARLLDLNKVKLNPKLNYVSGKILVDSGNIFRQSAIINLGSLDGIVEGWAAMDGLGLVGRISGVGKKTSRVLFLTDTSSNVPVLIKPSNQRAILSGDNSIQPNLLFIENNKQIQPGDRILTSGDGGVFPANLLIGQVSLNNLNQFKAQLSANFSGLEYLRIIRHSPNATINQPSRLIGPALTKAESHD